MAPGERFLVPVMVDDTRIDRAESRIAADESSEVPDIMSARLHVALGRPDKALALIDAIRLGNGRK